MFPFFIQEVCEEINQTLSKSGVDLKECYVTPINESSLTVYVHGEDRGACRGLASVRTTGGVTHYIGHMYTHKHTTWKKRSTLVDRVSKCVLDLYTRDSKRKFERSWVCHVYSLMKGIAGLRHYSGTCYRVQGTDVQLDVGPHKISVSSRSYGIYTDIGYEPFETLDLVIQSQVETVVRETQKIREAVDTGRKALERL